MKAINLLPILFLTVRLGISSASPTPEIIPFPSPDTNISTDREGKQLHPFDLHADAHPLAHPYLYPQTDLAHWPEHVRRNLPWGLQVEYSGTNFFDGWEFFTEPGKLSGRGVLSIDSTDVCLVFLSLLVGSNCVG